MTLDAILKRPLFSRCSAQLVRIALAVIFLSSTSVVAPLTAAESRSFAHLAPQKPISAPEGFAGLCDSYHWACAQGGDSKVNGSAVVKLANTINLSVNRQTRQISDKAQYGRSEVWALPTAQGGDCEDFVLLKKQLLLKAGVPASTLLIATVLDLNSRRHAVLILRTGAGDVVLDSLDNRIRHWVETGYTFLKLQNPRNPAVWDAIFAGGRIRSGPDTVIAMN